MRQTLDLSLLLSGEFIGPNRQLLATRPHRARRALHCTGFHHMTTVLEHLTEEHRRRLWEFCDDAGSMPGVFVLRQASPGMAVFPLLVGWYFILMFAGVVVGAIRAVAGASGIWAVSGFAAPLAIPWCAIVIQDRLRRRGSHLRAGTLVTPVEIVVTEYDHGPLDAHRLRDADEFQRIQTYDAHNRRTGMRYDFRFGKKSVFLNVKELAEEEQLESVLAQARVLKDNPASQSRAMANWGVFPDNPVPPTLRRRLSWPRSKIWGQILMAYLVGGFLAVVLAIAYR